MVDLLIKNANLYMGDDKVLFGYDLAIKDGLIVESGIGLSLEAKEILEVKDQLITPTFLDTHMHIDYALTMEDDETTSLIYSCENYGKAGFRYLGLSDEQVYDDILRRSSKIVEMCISHGTTALKTNVWFDRFWKCLAMDAMVELKKRYKNYLEVLTAVPFDPMNMQAQLEYAKKGYVDFVAGYPHLTPDYKGDTDQCFEIAQKLGLPLDLHCDESDTINLNCFNYIIKKTKETGLSGHVTCGHVTGLNATNIPEEMVNESIASAAEVDMNVTSLTSCNMYLMDFSRRGPTRVRQLMEAGVNVAVASDNIRDTFRPYGNCNLVEEANLTAQIHKFGTSQLLRKTMGMISYNAAKNAEAKDYGLKTGCKADFNIFEVPTPEAVLINNSKKMKTFKNGRLICENGVINRAYMKL